MSHGHHEAAAMLRQEQATVESYLNSIDLERIDAWFAQLNNSLPTDNLETTSTESHTIGRSSLYTAPSSISSSQCEAKETNHSLRSQHADEGAVLFEALQTGLIAYAAEEVKGILRPTSFRQALQQVRSSVRQEDLIGSGRQRILDWLLEAAVPVDAPIDIQELYDCMAGEDFVLYEASSRCTEVLSDERCPVDLTCLAPFWYLRKDVQHQKAPEYPPGIKDGDAEGQLSAHSVPVLYTIGSIQAV